MSPRRVLPAVAFAILLGASNVPAQSVLLPTDFLDETIVGGLGEPHSMAFLPDGRLLLTERATARVRMVVNGHLTAINPLTVLGVTAGGERGLQGIAVDPRWPQFPYLYVCYTSAGDRMALTRYTGRGHIDNPVGERLTFGSPLVLIDDFADHHEIHNGLCLRFSADGRLLMTTGDDNDHCSAQVPGSLQGVLLRLDVSRLPPDSGGPVPRALLIPPDNPLSGPDSNSQLVYAYGLRNPWRFHVDPSTGAILLADVGFDAYEELDEVLAGDNLGWPYREGIEEHARPDCGPGSGLYGSPILTVPWGTFTVITTAGLYRPVASGSAIWPNLYWGNLFYGDFYSGRLRRLMRSGGAWVPAASVPGQPNANDWATGAARGTDFTIGPDGSLYWLQMTDGAGNPASGTLRRIRYTGPPVSVAPGAVSPRSLSAAPNPFRGRVELSWRLALSAPVTIEVFDLAGRRVRRLHDDTGGVEGRATWDGRDDLGGRAPPGLYLARLAGDRHVEPVRLLLLD